MKTRKKSLIDIIKMTIVYIAIIVLWQICYWLLVEQLTIVKAYIFPSPFGVANAFLRLIENNLLFFALLSSICNATELALKSVNPIFIKAARTMGANNAEVFFQVILPASLPECISGLKHGWSFAWRALIAGEMISGTVGGLGYVLLIGRELLDINQIMLVIMILIMISVVIEKLLLGKMESMARKKMGQISNAD